MKSFRIALAGNPNCGKTTIFNELTGAHQHVGNWPGKTVEQKSGFILVDDVEIEIIDLPGTYSLNAYSMEEIIARDYLLKEQPDLVMCVVDAANLERNLYLTVQVLELGIPVIVALNMTDIAKHRGIVTDIEKLSQALQSPIFCTTAREGKGIEDMVNYIIQLARQCCCSRRDGGEHHHTQSADCIRRRHKDHARSRHWHYGPRHHRHRKPGNPQGKTRHEHSGMHFHDNAYSRHQQGYSIDYGLEIEEEIVLLQESIEQHEKIKIITSSRWLAVKLLERDFDIEAKLEGLPGSEEIFDLRDKSLKHLQSIFGEDIDTIMPDRRYGWINGLVRETTHHTKRNLLTHSDRVDRIVTHRIWGIPIFLIMMWFVFKFTTDVATPYFDWVDYVINEPVTRWVGAVISYLGLAGTWLDSLINDGLIAGVGGVLVFIPVLMFLYLALAILEDSGYMSRAAFVMDRLMHALGLHGKSFVPMVVGFGCTVSAFYATRTLENRKNKILTGLLVPFMSCGARLPVYVLFAAIFFPANPSAVVFSMYALGILIAIIIGLILKNALFQEKEEAPFVIELPPYRLPTLKSLWFHMWERTSSFLKHATSIILIASLVLWFLQAIPIRGDGTFADTPVENSAFASVVSNVVPVFQPLGFGSWEAGGALVTGLVAKEVVISTFSQIYGIDSAENENVVEETPTLFEDIGQILIRFGEATVNTIKSVPIVVGINLLPEETEQSEPSSLMTAISQGFEESSNGHGTLAGLAFMVFVLIYTPCMASLAAERQELGARWMWVSIIGQLILAWIVSFAVFQGGLLFGLG
jgi:ferrous iron transport protein B